MAIHNKNINNKQNNKPESLIVIPKNNPNHQSSPGDFHHHEKPIVKLYNSFEEAKNACEIIFLKPGEAHTEFYKKDNIYHCVVAIGNIDYDTPHLYLTDSGSEMSLFDQLTLIKNLAEDANVTAHRVEQALEILNSSVNNITNDINLINDSINIINSSIIEIKDLINEIRVYPTADTSIESLFHDDIYTINLCCYTAGGHIEIFDNIAGIEMGGDSSRVAPCTPFNEYKTYVIGDQVELKAVPNEGYRLTYWVLDSDFTNPIYDQSVQYTFNEDRGDINVIGTLNTADEDKPIKNGYTAIFNKLYKLHFDTSLLNADLADNFGDSLILSGDVYNIVGDVAYIDINGNVTTEARPVNKHNFKYFVIDSSIITDINPYTLFSINEDHTITGYFEEERYSFFAEPNIADYGNIEATYTLNSRPYAPKENTVITGVNVELNPIPVEGYHFNCWKYGLEEPWAGEVYSYDEQINVLIDANSVKYLVAEFEENILPELDIFNLNIPTKNGVDESTVIGSYNINNGSFVGNSNFGGIKFGAASLDFSKNYVEITPIEQINSNCILEVKCWLKDSGSGPISKSLKFKMNNEIFEKEVLFENYVSDDKNITENEIVTYTYQFENNINGSIFVGIGVNTIKIHSIKINKINE